MNVLITGSSRGLGLGMVQYLLENTVETVIAGCRSPATSVQLLALESKFNVDGKKRLIILPLDTTSVDNHRIFLSSLSTHGISSIDILILNAGIANSTHPYDNFMSCSVEDMTNVYHTNVVGTLLSLQTYHQLLMRSLAKVVVVMSSNLGSITNNFGGFTSYRASKCALNMLAVTYSKDSVHDTAAAGDNDKSRVKVVCVHPGWVQTDMGNADGRTADITVEESVGGLMKIVYWAVLSNSEGNKNVVTVKDSHERLMKLHNNRTRMETVQYQEVISSSHCCFVGQDGREIGW